MNEERPWHPSQEELLRKVADESKIRENLHRESLYFYSRWENYLSLPVILLSAISGSLQFMSSSQTDKATAQIIITSTGTISVFVSILSAVNSFLKFAELKKTHESVCNAWLSLYSQISSQLALSRDLREPPDEFVASIMNQYNHLYEISPIIRRSFIERVKRKLIIQNDEHPDQAIECPPYLNGLTQTAIFMELE
jgi:surface polysaccharide O-acyltransferase-like enzyme